MKIVFNKRKFILNLKSSTEKALPKKRRTQKKKTNIDSVLNPFNFLFSLPMMMMMALFCLTYLHDCCCFCSLSIIRCIYFHFIHEILHSFYSILRFFFSLSSWFRLLIVEKYVHTWLWLYKST